VRNSSRIALIPSGVIDFDVSSDVNNDVASSGTAE
jgi:hypothetical protein